MTTEILRDIGFLVQALGGEYSCEFWVKKAFIQDRRDYQLPPLVEYESEKFGRTEHADEAVVYLHGHIKWDGCSNWYFDEQDQAMLHFCSKEQAAEIGVLLGRLYDMAPQLISHWCP